MKNLLVLLICGALLLNLMGCSTNTQISQASAQSRNKPYADEVFIYDSEEKFAQAFSDKNGGIAKMEYTLPDFYLRPVNMPEELKFKSIQLEPYGYTWRYTTPEETEVWISTTHELFSESQTLEDEVKATFPTKFDLIKKISIDGRDYMYLDALDVELGFTVINFMEHDTLVGVLVAGYSFSEDMIKKYCNVEAVPINNTVREKR